jgi:AraC-like DNA-binding protein
VSELAVNPPASQLGRVNAIVAGRARHYDQRFAGPLSIKSVVRGAAVWETDGARFEVTPHLVLIVNDGEEYAIEIDAREPVETFCVFFARGFVEDALVSATTSSAQLLDDYVPHPTTFAERWSFDARLLAALDDVRENSSDEQIYALANEIVRTQCDLDARMARIPFVRASTRDEIRSRLARGVAFIHGSISEPFTVADVAREACLSRFHFHRLFTAMTGETPHRYIARLRLGRARAMLRDRRRSIGEVALASGFATPSAFSSAYSKYFGVSPKKQL